GLVARITGRERQEEVTLAAGEGSYLYLLGPAIARYDGRLELLTLGGPATLAAVRSGRAHLGVGVFDVIPRGVTGQPIATTPVVAALPREHRLAKRKQVRLRDLAGERLVLAPMGQK